MAYSALGRSARLPIDFRSNRVPRHWLLGDRVVFAGDGSLTADGWPARFQSCPVEPAAAGLLVAAALAGLLGGMRYGEAPSLDRD